MATCQQLLVIAAFCVSLGVSSIDWISTNHSISNPITNAISILHQADEHNSYIIILGGYYHVTTNGNSSFMFNQQSYIARIENYSPLQLLKLNSETSIFDIAQNKWNDYLLKDFYCTDQCWATVLNSVYFIPRPNNRDNPTFLYRYVLCVQKSISIL